jgi:hypothetical protein
MSRPLSSIERFLFTRSEVGSYKSVASWIRLKSHSPLNVDHLKKEILKAISLVIARTVNLRCTVFRPMGKESPEMIVLPPESFGLNKDISTIEEHPLIKSNIVKFLHRSNVKIEELWTWNQDCEFPSNTPNYEELPTFLDHLENADAIDLVLNNVLEACNEHLFCHAPPCQDAETVRQKGLDNCFWNLFVLYDEGPFVDLIFHYDHTIADGRSGMIIWEILLQAWQDLASFPTDFPTEQVQGTRPHSSLDEGLGSVMKMGTGRLVTDLFKEIILPKSLKRIFYPAKHWVGPEVIDTSSKQTIVKPLHLVNQWPTRCTIVDFPDQLNGQDLVKLMKRITSENGTTLHGYFLAAGVVATARLARKVGQGYISGKHALDKKHLIGPKSNNMMTVSTASPTCLRKFANTGSKPSGIALPDKYMGAFVSELHGVVSFSLDEAESRTQFWQMATSLSQQIHKEMEEGEMIELLASTKYIQGSWLEFIQKMRLADPKGMSTTFGSSNVRSWEFPTVNSNYTPLKAGFTQTSGTPGFVGVDITTANSKVVACINSRPGVYGGEGYTRAYPASNPVSSEWLAIQQWIRDWKQLLLDVLA